MGTLIHFMDLIHPSMAAKTITFGVSYAPEDLSQQKWDNINNSQSNVLIPFFGARVSCGLFGISDDYIEKYQSLDSRFVKNKASTFFFEAANNSMAPLICAKDVLVVDRSLEPSHNRVAVICLNGEMICKRLIKTKNGPILRSDNPVYKDFQVTEEMEMTVWGVVVAIARELV